MAFDDLSTGSTWSWFPAACAAALGTLRRFREEPILENVRALEAMALQELPAMMARHPGIGDVRAIGCFWAIEFVKDRETKERDPAMQERVAREALARGVIGDPSTTSYNLQPSLVTPVEVAGRALTIVDEAISVAEEAMGD
jgi:4-aminobutyrate aminotransferase-like enzyme